MSTEEYIIQQRKIFTQIIEKDMPLQRAARDTMAMQATRIFVDGKNSQGSLIGGGAYNDNKPLYVNPNTSPGKKFKPAGKPFEFGKSKGGKIKTVRSESRLVNGKSTPHKTRWFPSYKDYRKTIGRNTEHVDLFLSGDLKSDFSNGKTGASPVKVNTHEYVAGLKRQENIKKAEGLSDKYNDPIFSLSKKEKANFFDIAQ
ncbi:MAG: hypothetical protein ACEQSL_07705 [Sediminibacterium sp.]